MGKIAYIHWWLMTYIRDQRRNARAARAMREQSTCEKPMSKMQESIVFLLAHIDKCLMSIKFEPSWLHHVVWSSWIVCFRSRYFVLKSSVLPRFPIFIQNFFRFLSISITSVAVFFLFCFIPPYFAMIFTFFAISFTICVMRMFV